MRKVIMLSTLTDNDGLFRRSRAYDVVAEKAAEWVGKGLARYDDEGAPAERRETAMRKDKGEKR